ncbi:hypothetical protein JHN60_34205, partial [Streptomyces sp. MBT51]|nr:hypothetical protein [Streptomyces sp. MBT51]
MVGLGLGELAAVLRLCDGQGVLVPYALQLGPELGHLLDVIPDVAGAAGAR